MSRLTKLCCISLVFVFVLGGTVRAEQPHKAWWEFLKGEWTWEISPLDTKGTSTYRSSSKGSAVVGRFKASDGTMSTELSGWRSDTKTYVVVGFGSDGNYWMLESKDVSANGFTGSHVGVLSDGQAFKGRISVKKVNDNQFEWKSRGKMSDGEEYDLTGKVVRKTE